MALSIPTWTTIHQEDSFDHASDIQALRTVLEKGNDDAKIQTMQKILVIMLNGDSLPGLLMHIIRFIMPSKSKPLKKLLYAYWEICPKLNPDGKLKQEMILVCNAIRNDLQHPNEYVCGMTLRFLCKLQEAELLEPLLPSCRACLTHRHSYVRKNAIFAIYSIYHHSEHLVPDAPDLISSFLQTESDQICRRNAFIVLCNISLQRAVEYILQNFDNILTMDSMMQSAIIELIQKDITLNSLNKAKYLQLMFDFLDLPSTTVVYEAANILAALTNNSVVLKAAASKFIELAIKESDNNIKLIVLDKLDKLHAENEGILEDLVMEVLVVLSSTDLDVRRKALEIALKMVTSANVTQVLSFLEKDLVKTIEQDYENNTEYRQLLIQAIHSCAVRYSEVAAKGSYLLMEHIGEFSNTSAVDVIGFIREVIEKFPSLRDGIIQNLLLMLMDIKAKKIFRGALWILGEYCLSEKDIKEALRGIRKSIGELPILDTEQKLLAMDEASKGIDTGSSETPVHHTSTRVLADGTYATESALTESTKSQVTSTSSKPPLRALILDGDYYLMTILSSTLTKLVMRFSEMEDGDLANSFRAEAMLIMSSIIRIGQSHFVKTRIDEDSVHRIMICFRALLDFKQEKNVEDAFLKETKSVYTTMLSTEDKLQKEKAQQEKNASAIQVDDVISIRQLSKKKMDNKIIDEPELNLSTAMIDDDKASTDNISSKLSRITQLTGFSDPVYAEAFIQVNKFDIVLDILLVNQTAEVLQNLSLEFAVLGDLKLLDRPVSQTLAAHSFLSIQATVKVSSADAGVIFGSIVYDRSGSIEQEIVILNDIHIDVMDYIKPAICTENQFRSMWTEFEWENKVNINSRESDLTLREYLKKLMERTNMSCLTPEASLKGDCSFLSANLYAKSTFGEDVLANLSVEKGDDGKIVGHVRIRSKGQGIALSLGHIVVR